jgi:hypothetical protein
MYAMRRTKESTKGEEMSKTQGTQIYLTAFPPIWFNLPRTKSKKIRIQKKNEG